MKVESLSPTSTNKNESSCEIIYDQNLFEPITLKQAYVAISLTLAGQTIGNK